MFARFVLPLFGGAPAVWNTSMVFFQTALLAGYLYAHATTRRLGVRRQAALHLGVVLLPLVVLPLAVPDGWAPAEGESPVPLLLGLLLVAVGPPFFVVSTTAPLLQRWLGGTDHPAARDPYFLYRASNIGSVLGLLAYPLAVEPTLRLAEQAVVWAVGYSLLAALVAACAAAVWRSGRPPSGWAPAAPPAPDPDASTAAERPVTVKRRLRWIGLAFVPSSLMLGVTSYMTVDLAPVPLLWSVPLSLYLVSFIVAFAPGARNERRHRRLVLGLPVAALLLSLLVLLEAREPLWLLIPLHLTGFLVAALVCHGELARDRPAVRSLTEFYIWMAVGGVLGGVFNALLAPVLFDSLTEYPLVIALACLCLPRRPGRFPAGPQTRWLDFAAPALLGAVVATILALASRAGPEMELVGRGFALSMAAGVALNFARRPLRLALSVGAILLAGALLAPGDRVLYQERSFFGVNRVEAEPGGFHRLVNGTTTHGGQYRGPGRALEPTTYYHRSGPIGQFLTTVPRAGRTDRVAVLGLGGGGMACHARQGERWTFYEVDPTVERLARDPRLFTFLRDCPGRHEVVLGDARLSLAHARERAYGLIVGDVFSSDAIPVHLLTREAIRLYRSKLTADGVLALHISNRYLDLGPVAAALARDAGLACLSQAEPQAAARRVPGKAAAHWVLMTASPDRLGPVATDPRWRPCRSEPGAEVWTDDFSNIVEALDLPLIPAGSGEKVERASLTR
ncbi:MAG: fused MFS/spermidine synthase [Actinomycetota bacterium]|nr:fused MFS/spermidine synthase [Actinomycetota bacterium]